MSAVGAIVLAASLLLPWYGVGLAAHSGLGAAPHHHLDAVSGLHALHDLSVVLLAMAGLAILDALAPLARAGASVPGGAGGSVVLLGAVASACVLYRMIDPPAPAGELLSMSLREGAWLALLGSLTIALGGMWPRYRDLRGAAAPDRSSALSW